MKPRTGWLARMAGRGALVLNAALVAGVLAFALLLGLTTGEDDTPLASVATVRAQPAPDPFAGFVPTNGDTVP